MAITFQGPVATMLPPGAAIPVAAENDKRGALPAPAPAPALAPPRLPPPPASCRASASRFFADANKLSNSALLSRFFSPARTASDSAASPEATRPMSSLDQRQ